MSQGSMHAPQQPVATPTKIKIAQPDPYDGDPKNFKGFMRAVHLLIAAQKITADGDKIIIVLSYMKDEAAGRWVQAKMDVIFGTVPPVFGTWQDFLDELVNRFEDKVSKQQARARLEKYQQKSDVDQHINILNEFFMNAELTDAREKIRLLEKSTNNSIIDVIYSDATGALPTTYDRYVDKVLLIG